jgi:hypothetical protein
MGRMRNPKGEYTGPGMSMRRPPFFRWVLAVGGFSLFAVLMPLLDQYFYDSWFKAHMPVMLEGVLSFRWTPVIVSVIGLLVILALLIWPNVAHRPKAAPQPTIFAPTIYLFNATVSVSLVVIEGSDLVEGAADEAPEDDVPDGPLGDATE